MAWSALWNEIMASEPCGDDFATTAAPSERVEGRDRASVWMLPLVLLIAIVWLFRTPYVASNLDATPDAVEYSVSPVQLLTNGRYQIILEGRSLPPRYPPWFSTLVILPAYMVLGVEPGNAIWPITLFAVAGVACGWAIGRRVSSTAGGLFSALALMFIPSYGAWATQIMTDVPCVTLMLATCLVFLRLRSEKRAPHLALFFGAGLLVALTTLFRSTFAAMIVPFLIAAWTSRNAFLRRSAVFLAPMAVAMGATLLYNSATFGSPWRNGYHFWAPVPYDYPNLVFSAGNVTMNLSFLGQTAFPLLFLACVGVWILERVRKPGAVATESEPFRSLLLFLGLTNAPILIFHLLYFYPADRFFLPLLAGAAVVLGSIMGRLIFTKRETVLWSILVAASLFVVAGKLVSTEPIPNRRLAVERIKQWTPEDALVISSVDPVYLENQLGRGSRRQIIPTSRDVEYASSLLAPKRVDHPVPPPSSWLDGRAPGVIRGGAINAVQFVASEQIDTLVAYVAQGKRLFIETGLVDTVEIPVIERLKQRFTLEPVTDALYELKSR